MRPVTLGGATSSPRDTARNAVRVSARVDDFDTTPVAPAARHEASTKRRSSWV
jgi:hypothetical protein